MKFSSGSFRNTQWDPRLIIGQILAMQSVLYFTLGLLISILNIISGDTDSLQHIFEYHEIHVRDIGGRMVILAFLMNSFIGALSLWFIVQRTKQCLDFSCTWHLIHLVLCWFYNGSFPVSLSWWLMNIACLISMCVTGEFLCLKSELRDIPLALGTKIDL